jgi:hypothetical protein
LEEAVERLDAAMARWCRVNAELEALRVGDTGRSSSLAASLAEATGEVEDRINAVAANGVR